MDLKGKTILISGIGGFIGRRAAELCISRGLRVLGLELSSERAESACSLGAIVTVGDVTDPDAARQACQGADIVLHTAAIVNEGGSFDEFRRVNVGGTVTLGWAARKAGARVFVHLSSIMVYGFSYPPFVAEDGPRRGENNPYCQTKIESEDEVGKLNEAGHFGVIIVRPGDVYGPGSLPWVVRPLQLMRMKRFFLVSGGRGIINHVYVDNLINGVFLALESESYGETFNITDGAETTFQKYFIRLAEIGRLPPPRSLPKSAMRFLIRLKYACDILLRRHPDIHPEAVDFVDRPYAVSIEKARRCLDYSPRITLDEGFRRTAEWLDSVQFHV